MITTIPDRERALQAEVDALTAENARLREQEHIAWVRFQEHPNRPTTIHLCDSDHPRALKVYAAPPSQPAEPVIDEQVASVNAVFDAWRNGEDATLTLGLAAQPAHPDEFACPLCFDDPANIKPAEPVQLTETEIFKAYTTATGKVLPNKWGVREELVAITRIVERAHGITGEKK